MRQSGKRYRVVVSDRAKEMMGALRSLETMPERFPFEVSIDPFYSKRNLDYLRKVTADIDAGRAELVEHALIEE